MIAVAVVVTGWAAGWLLLWRPPRLGGAAADLPRRRPASVSIVVPARDEADRLPDLLASLADQVGPEVEVVVVDDDSHDATAEVAARHAVEVVRAPPRPEGWTGKTWACHVGAGAATGDVLVFVDADVTFAPGALDAVLALLAERGGLVSVQPHHHPRRPVERLSLFANIVVVMALGIAVPGRRPGWGVAGPVLATARRDLERAGGHGAVRTEVAEDLALAARYRAVGAPLTCVLGGDLVRFRMYRDLSGLVAGWTKNMATGARRAPALLSAAVGLWVTALAWTALLVGQELASGPTPAAALAAAAGYLAVAVQVSSLGRRVGRFGLLGAAWPVPLAVFVLIVVGSVAATLGAGRVRWSGRTVRVRRV